MYLLDLKRKPYFAIDKNLNPTFLCIKSLYKTYVNLTYLLDQGAPEDLAAPPARKHIRLYCGGPYQIPIKSPMSFYPRKNNRKGSCLMHNAWLKRFENIFFLRRQWIKTLEKDAVKSLMSILLSSLRGPPGIFDDNYYIHTITAEQQHCG